MMINYWWVTRPKRKLNSIPEVLSIFADIALDQEWQGQRNSHLSFEEMLERDGLKRTGERRDQTGGGARTYKVWVMSLGLIFTQESTRKTKLTCAGEAIMNGDNPVDILKSQILKYQFPSSFSLGSHIKVSERFKIRPFIFLFKLLSDSRIKYLTTEEIAKIVVVEAENETDKCYEYIVARILEFRMVGDVCLDNDFFEKYGPSKGTVNLEHPYSHLLDLANTILNWMEYTQLAKRENGSIEILEDKVMEVTKIINTPPPFIDRPWEHEFFQRKYGIDPKRKKDTRDLTKASVITTKMIVQQKIKNAFIAESLKRPISAVDVKLIDKIADMTGIIDIKLIEDTLLENYAHGSIGAFMTEYFEMAFRGKDDATNFEVATVEIFESVFKFKAKHVGPIGLTPDVLVVSDIAGYSAIIDNKAYSQYTINNDHHNRMVYNYIGNLSNYYTDTKPLAFFSYISGGFGKNINKQLKSITKETGVSGSAMTVSNMIELIKIYEQQSYTHNTIRDIFSVGRQVLLSDF